MRKYLFLLLVGYCLLAVSCKKSSAADEINETVPTGAKVQMGSFVSNVHPTSGMATVVEANGKKYLNFESFRSDNGPDLRVYLSKNTGVADFVSLGVLKAVNGNFSYELSAAQNTSVYTHVLIWCEDFSVLFGHAVLQ